MSPEEIQKQAARAGSYNYLCESGGVTFFSHTPVGSVICTIPHIQQLKAS